jgi:hypothetical protein
MVMTARTAADRAKAAEAEFSSIAATDGLQ